MRIELLTPKGDFVLSETYNKLFTIHGVLMVWFFLIPSIPTVLGNFLIPLMIGARDLAFPKLNLASWYIFVLAGAFTLYSVFAGGVETGWTFYTPLSTKYTNTHVFAMADGRVHLRVLVHPDGAELHHHHPQDARPRHDVDAPAAVLLVDVRDEPHHGPGDARARRRDDAPGHRAAVGRGHLRPGAGWRPGVVPAPVLVLLAPGGLHHDPAGLRGDQRTHH